MVATALQWCWDGRGEASPCLLWLWLAPNLLLYSKYYFWRLGGEMWEEEGCGSAVPSLISGMLLQMLWVFFSQESAY